MKTRKSELVTETTESKEFEAMFETTERETQFPTLKASEGYENTNNGYAGSIAKRFASAKAVDGFLSLRVDEDSRFYADVETIEKYIDDLIECEETDVTEIYRRELKEEPYSPEYWVERYLLNGADNWRHYSEGGSALCYDRELAERFQISIEMVRYNGLELQGLALRKACELIIEAIKFLFA